jgi:hypothetical protein
VDQDQAIENVVSKSPLRCAELSCPLLQNFLTILRFADRRHLTSEILASIKACSSGNLNLAERYKLLRLIS